MKIVNTRYSKKSEGHYSPGVIHNGTLYISGQLSIDPATNKNPSGDIVEETWQALNNLELVLKSAGITKNEVIQCRVYTPDVKYWDEINKVYSKFFGEHKPSRVVVPSNCLHSGCLVEIEAIAVCEVNEDENK